MFSEWPFLFERRTTKKNAKINKELQHIRMVFISSDVRAGYYLLRFLNPNKIIIATFVIELE